MGALTDKQAVPMSGNRSAGIVTNPVVVPLTKEGLINLSGPALADARTGGNVATHGKAKIQGSGISRRA